MSQYEHIAPIDPRTPLGHELSAIRASWGWLLGLGILMILLGAFLILIPWITTQVAVWVLGALLVIGGIVQCAGAFTARRWSGFGLSLVAGILYLVVGMLIFFFTEESIVGLTLLLAAFLLAVGIFRIAASLMMQFENWAWGLAGGILATLLGVLILIGWPEISAWVIGLFVGIEVLFTGIVWVFIALALREGTTVEGPRQTPAV